MRAPAWAKLVLAGLALLLLGWVFDPSPLFVPAVAFILLGTAVPLWVWTCASGAGLSRELGSDRVIEGEPLRASVEVDRKSVV